jgi:predicted nucleic acid-binding protein
MEPLEQGTIEASVLSRTEILGGRPPNARAYAEELFSVIGWIPVSDAIADLAADYTWLYRRSHSGIDLTDYVIAATAAVTGTELWTLNVKHFPMFPDLEPPY